MHATTPNALAGRTAFQEYLRTYHPYVAILGSAEPGKVPDQCLFCQHCGADWDAVCEPLGEAWTLDRVACCDDCVTLIGKGATQALLHRTLGFLPFDIDLTEAGHVLSEVHQGFWLALVNVERHREVAA